MATTWVVTKGMNHLLDQINAVGPDRDKASDGSIGDPAHQNESASSHNPDSTGAAEWKDGDSKNEVRARDVDNSGPWLPGVTAEKIVQHLVQLGRSGNLETRIRYIIYNRRIWSASNNWSTQTYSGASPHTEHIHFTGAFSQASDEDSPYYDYRLEELMADVEISDASVDKIIIAMGNTIKNQASVLAGAMKAVTWQYGDGVALAGLAYPSKSALYQFTMMAQNIEGIKTALAAVAAGDDAEVAQVLAALDAQKAELESAINQSKLELATDIDEVDEAVIAKLGDPATPDQQVADALTALLGARKDAVLALMH